MSANAWRPMTFVEWCAVHQLEETLLQCDECRGSGKADCEQCDPNGVCVCDCGHRHVCEACHGKHQVDCDYCWGTGTVDSRRFEYTEQLEADRAALRRAGRLEEEGR